MTPGREFREFHRKDRGKTDPGSGPHGAAETKWFSDSDFRLSGSLRKSTWVGEPRGRGTAGESREWKSTWVGELALSVRMEGV